MDSRLLATAKTSKTELFYGLRCAFLPNVTSQSILKGLNKIGRAKDTLSLGDYGRNLRKILDAYLLVGIKVAF